MSNGLIFDVILVALFAISVLRGWRRGVLSMLVKALGWGLAVFLIVGYSATWAETVYHNAVEQPVITMVTSAIPAEAVEAMNSSAATVAGIQSALDSFSGLFGGVTVDTSAMDTLSSFMGQGVDELAVGVTQTVLQPILITAIKVALSALILFVCLFVFGILSRLLMRKKEGGTILGKMNKILGGTVGALMGGAEVYIYCLLLSALADMPKIGWVTSELLESTVIVSRLIR